ncbi:cobyrinic acid a,c-diamide synthase [Prosthecochloris sp. GSB1]|uniref:cobyrinate a,c-diamide synthase n=1 Tax=Prosthecochloris sp. GSB1 TaxID=281093 RepID=UPI000B8C9303|nr:cobyrinate a,c-diamide synthase [Prosthecochloris sp. GSB1]ASQ89809.1 cobyrinic acid a,c-diamide synthase [Prosthecochloris sp. GSB1]
MQKPAFLLAAPASGTGKTTLALALLRLFADRGLRPRPFKCGPDYLDTCLHTLAAARGDDGLAGINLDLFMAGESHVRELFRKKCTDADAAVVEGVMGLFDGAVRSEGSSASIAKLLGIPVILVVDAGGAAYSVAALLYGFGRFDPGLRLAGVIFNRVNSASHYAFLEDACRDVGVEPLGYVPDNQAMKVPERYLGLDISPDAGHEAAIAAMAEHVRKTVDIDRLLHIASVDMRRPEPRLHEAGNGGDAVIAVARDEAFNFLYAENLDLLAEYGRLEFFSPLGDGRLPDADMLYLAGGYPELFAGRLSRNASMRAEIAAYCRRGGVVYAECGGMMYLAGTLTDREGRSHSMCGVLDMDISMQDSRLHLGYRKVKLHDTAYGRELRGHEFHYSRIIRGGSPEHAASVASARDKPLDTGFFRYRNTFASYIHLYWGETRDFPGYLLSQGPARKVADGVFPSRAASSGMANKK